ncbi:hypothetical protein OfM1_07190 [Lactovum odontotermitis]
MKTKTILILAAAALSLGFSAKASADTQMQRLYNPNSGEHFYTARIAEKDNLVAAGWRYEGIGWVAPDSGEPVYRLYNANAGDHHYTKIAYEKDQLIAAGWHDEGIAWYSGGAVPLYRAYNPNVTAGAHNYTTSDFEQNSLLAAGWNDEGIAWYGTAVGSPAGGQYYQSDFWYRAAPGMVFISDSGKAYTRVVNIENYSYVAWANQPTGAGNGSAQFIQSDLG